MLSYALHYAPMYVESVPNRGSNPAILLRESYREGGKVKKRTVGNISGLASDKVESAPKTPFRQPSPTAGLRIGTRKLSSVRKGFSRNRRWKNAASRWSVGWNERS